MLCAYILPMQNLYVIILPLVLNLSHLYYSSLLQMGQSADRIVICIKYNINKTLSTGADIATVTYNNGNALPILLLLLSEY